MHIWIAVDVIELLVVYVPDIWCKQLPLQKSRKWNLLKNRINLYLGYKKF